LVQLGQGGADRIVQGGLIALGETLDHQTVGFECGSWHWVRLSAHLT
jgi:hypothetical protein